MIYLDILQSVRVVSNQKVGTGIDETMGIGHLLQQRMHSILTAPVQ